MMVLSVSAFFLSSSSHRLCQQLQLVRELRRLLLVARHSLRSRHSFTTVLFPFSLRTLSAWIKIQFPCQISRGMKPSCYEKASWRPSVGTRREPSNTWKLRGGKHTQSRGCRRFRHLNKNAKRSKSRISQEKRRSQETLSSKLRKEEVNHRRLRGRHSPSQRHRLAAFPICPAKNRNVRLH